MPAVFLLSKVVSSSVELKRETAKSSQPQILQGSVARSELADNLDSVGIKCAPSLKNQAYPIVTSVRIASPADYGGILAEDQVVNFENTNAGFKITIRRKDKLYQVLLKAMSAQLQTPKLSGLINKSLLSGSQRSSSHPFLPATIAKDDFDGVEQSNKYLDCWFESCLSGLAHLPRGQQLISDMIVQNSNGSYSVTFPGGGTTTISSAELSTNGLSNRAIWASIVEGACLKMHNAREIGESLQHSNKPAIQIGMEMLTGVQANAIRADQCTASQFKEILVKAIENKTPVAFSTKNEKEKGGPSTLNTDHTYTLVAASQYSNEIILRDAYGKTVQRSVATLLKDIRYVSYPMW